ncbi:MAG: holo-ACP synthase [Candidatus Omnitrophica bacterium]|nr:holo-ACP synthase [Candidatus Omnitrophota bacterium]
MILGVGIDIIEIEKIKKVIDRWGDHFLNHVFHEEEIAYALKHKNSEQHFAARFAAKEAVYKAIPKNKKIGWKDIKILNDEEGRPYCQVNADKFNNNILISISHSDHYAVANAIITSE